MSAHEVPEHLREYFGHDKVAHHGRGGLPAAPPAPPGSTARKAGENAVADGLAKAGTPGLRPGARPAKVPPKPALPRRMRTSGERALFERTMRRLGPVAKAPAPHVGAGAFWRVAFAPAYSLIPWGIKRRMVTMTSGVKRWRT
ncbi:MAG TPA: hypothetical protein PKD59_05925 [Miltoncostaeaceae bacterium]|nr:hypothetical protein [Miltoncostaeaceae bacterium]